MKKYFLIGFLLLTACLSPLDGQGATPISTPAPKATATRSMPTMVIATVTSTTVPTTTATQPPPKRYFTEDFDAKPLYWSTLVASGASSNRVEILNKDGALTFELYAPVTWIYAIYGAFEYEGVHIETQFNSRGSKVNSMGLVCHYDEQDGWYEFNISSDGTYQLLYGQWLAEGIARYTPIINATSERIVTENATNEIGLDCYEDIVQLYINDKLIRKMDVSRYGLSGGKVGLSLGTFEEVPVILSFDWVKVGPVDVLSP